MQKLKSGILTTEFWVTLITSAMGIGVLLGYLQPAEADEMAKAIAQIIGGVVTLVTSVGYIYGRMVLKRTHAQNGSKLLTLPENSDDSQAKKPAEKFAE